MGLEIMAAGTAIMSGGAQLAGGLIEKNAIGDATNMQLDGNAQAQAQLQAFFDKGLNSYNQGMDSARGQLQPYADGQLEAFKKLQGLTDPNNEIYQQQRTVNTEAIQRQLAAQGLLRSKKQSDLLTGLELGLNQQRQAITGQIANNGASQQMAGMYADQGANLSGMYNQFGGNLAQLAQQNGQIRAGGRTGEAKALVGGIQGMANQINNTMSQFMSLGQMQQNQQLQQGYLSAYQQQVAQGGGGGGGQMPLSQQIGQYQLPLFRR